MNVVEVKNVTMNFNLPKEKVDSLKEYFIKLVKHQLMFEKFVALDNVSFEIAKGDVFGIVGFNGAGKSTILKIISGIIAPSEGSVVVDGEDELFTKKAGREMIFMANRSGCAFPGAPLVEATGSLYNFNIRAKIQGIGNQEAYENAVDRLVEKLLAFTGAPAPERGRHRIALFHASSRKTSNTLLLWSLIRRKMEDRALIREVSLRNGTVVDCRGCSYEACLHFGEQGDCFYGGVMVEAGYPAIRESDTLIFACPNYNDAVSANIMAFFNRMTALFRTDFREFAKKRIFALVVSGYSGGDIVAEQVIDALNCNKHFILPPHFALMETANDPGSILQNEGLEQRVEEMAERIGQ